MYRIQRCVFVLVILYSPAFAAEGLRLKEVGTPERHTIDVQSDVSVSRNEFLLGEPISIEVAVTNRYTEPVRIWDMIDRTFEFSAQDSSGRRVKELKKPLLSGLFRCVQARPSTTFSRLVFMNKHLDFPGPGVYEVEYRGHIFFQEMSESNSKASVHAVSLSGVITVKLREPLGDELENTLTEFLKQLKSGNNDLERQAARALSVSEPTLAAKLLRQAVTDESGAYPSYTSQVTWALARIGTDEAIQVLSDIAMHYKNTMVRTDAIGELGRQHIEKAVPTLVNLLSDQDSKIRASTLRALGCIGDKRCIAEIKLMLTDPDKEVRATAENVYNMLTKNEQ